MHLENLQQQTGITDLMLVPAECVEQSKYLYDYFLSMNRRRVNNGYGPLAITHMEMMAWAQLHGVGLSPFEVEVLDSIEDKYLQRCQARIRRELEKGAK
jgi:hypothetical protein